MKTLKYLSIAFTAFLLINCSNSDIDQPIAEKLDVDNISSSNIFEIGFPGTSDDDVIVSLERCVDENGVICDNPCNCRENSDVCKELCEIIEFQPFQVYTKKHKGRICDDDWSCIPKETFIDRFKIELKAVFPEKIQGAIVNKYGEVYAMASVIGYDKKSGVSRLGFELVNPEAAKEELNLQILTTVMDQGENVLEESVLFELRKDMLFN